MKLSKWLKQIDIESLSISTVTLWSDYKDEEEPIWEGHISQIPMEYLEYKIGITDDDPTVKPIMVFAKESEYGGYRPHFIITIQDPY